MPRFVILRHELPHRPSHWDVMLEADQSLWTWSITEIPGDGESVQAQRLPDHRAHYLDYEGPVSGDRGHVRRWESGSYETLRTSTQELVVRVQGHQLMCILSFRQIDDSDRWKLTLESSG